METTVARQIFDLLRTAKKPVLISDKRIDGDSMGSSLAVLEYLKTLGKETQVYVPSEVPEKYRFLPNAERGTFDRAIFNDPEIDLVVSFDCSEAAYIQELMKLIPGRPTLVNIDHHATNARYGDVNLVVVGSPATAEVVHAFFRVNDVVPSRDAATCLLAGLCFDTTIFTNGGTDERAFAAASDLLLRGGRIQDVIRALFRNRTVDALRLWGVALIGEVVRSVGEAVDGRDRRPHRGWAQPGCDRKVLVVIDGHGGFRRGLSGALRAVPAPCPRGRRGAPVRREVRGGEGGVAARAD